LPVSNSNNFLKDFLNLIKNKNVLITSHYNSDIDSLASALILQSICKKFGKKCCIYFKNLSKEADYAIKELNIKIENCDNISYDVIIILDVANPVQLKGLEEILNKVKIKIQIDHHKEGELYKIMDLYYIDKEATSTTEIITNFAKGLAINFYENIATLGILGILFDSNKLERANKNTFYDIIYLLEQNANYNNARNIFNKIVSSLEDDFSNRMARLKGLSRATLGKACKDLILALTEIGSFESEVSRSLILNGADVAITINRSVPTRISIRASERALLKKIDASKISKLIGEKFDGEGGGHKGAGIVTLKGIVEKEKVFNYAMQLINNECKSSESKDG
jgi:nanoRNase/pAp phosphatase (c-di-AMP/oligoRNAs hydrolase)